MSHIFKQITLFLLILFGAIVCNGQDPSAYFKNFGISNNKIYILLADGSLKTFDADKGTLLGNYKPKSKIRLLSLDHNNDVIIANDNNLVKRLNQNNNSWIQIAAYKGEKLGGIVFNNKNDCFFITDKGIVNTKTNKTYLPKLIHIGRGMGWQTDNEAKPTFVDKNDNLWILVDHGEWGRDIVIFNMLTNDFIGCDGYLGMPFYEHNGRVFADDVNDMLVHSIIQYDKKWDAKKQLQYYGKVIYDDNNDPTNPTSIYTNKNRVDLESFTYNPADGYMYVVTNKGLIKANPLRHFSKYSDWTLIKSFTFPADRLNKRIYYSENQKVVEKIKPDQPAYISKIQFTKKGNLVLLAQEGGVWLFDGKKLITLE